SIDPRFSITVNATGEKINYSFHAKEPVQAQISLRCPSESGRKKADDLFLRGRPIKVNPGELEISGLPLASEMMKRGGTVHLRTRTRATARFSSGDGGGNVTFFDVPGRAEGGPQEIRFRGQSHGIVLRMLC